MALLLFILFSWGVLNFWNHLMQLIDEDIDSTLPSSWLIRVMLIIAAFSCLFQKRPGVLTYLVNITIGLIIIFILCVTAFHLFFNMLPDFSDFVFYYEC
ncbi:transporter, partial [Salmonella enterica]|nr:transporter [Salmonella enterica]